MGRLVIFDFDGVLIDSEVIALAVLADALARYGRALTPAEIALRFIGSGVADILAMLAAEGGAPFPPALAAEIEASIVEQLGRAAAPVAGMAALLATLTPGSWCIASNSATERVRRCFEAAGLARRFDPPIFTASMVRLGKPAPDLHLLAASSLNCAPADALVIEDTPVGVRAAKAAGMACIGFLGGSHAGAPGYGDRLKAAGADQLATDATALAAFIADHTMAEPRP